MKPSRTHDRLESLRANGAAPEAFTCMVNFEPLGQEEIAAPGGNDAVSPGGGA
ncbi:MAG: hypothetical protein IIC13_13960 [SAR324 cluster bacterium]|nr:hypothetical protein [SAR324 cluster bacterium]MCH8887687.1 hypothetical protein [SAR324 cluster bacterium]